MYKDIPVFYKSPETPGCWKTPCAFRERETTYDTIKKKWAGTCKEVSGSYIHRKTESSTQSAVADPSCLVSKGWALKTSRRANRFSEKVKSHLKRIFLEGEETGRKATAVDVCSKMRALRDDSSRKVFSKEEWLAADQIARYFSRLSVLYRSGRQTIDQADPSYTQDEEEDFVAEAEEMSTRLQIQRQLEL